MKYILGVTKDIYENIKNTNDTTIGIYFIPEHRNLFIGDSIDLINEELKMSFSIKSIKYSDKLEENILLLNTNDSIYFTILELNKIYGK